MDTKYERVIAERDGRGWLVMWPDGQVDWKLSKSAVLTAIRERICEADILVTEIEWRYRRLTWQSDIEPLRP